MRGEEQKESPTEQHRGLSSRALRGCLVGLAALGLAAWLWPRQQSQAGRAKACVLSHAKPGWVKRAMGSTDTASLGRLFRQNGYRPPARGFLLMARVRRGVGGPAFEYVSLKSTGLVSSAGRFWPASSIKIWAAVGALMRLRKYGLDGSALLRFSDGAGSFRGTPAQLYRPLGNVHYDRLLRIASLSYLNGDLRKSLGYPSLFLRRGYGGTGSLRRTPAMPYLHHGRAGRLPAASSHQRWPQCKKNCTTLFELQDILRRIMLHRQLPRSQRLPLYASDLRRFRRGLLRQWKWVKAGVYDAFGRKVRIYSKAGSVPGNHLLDNQFIQTPKGAYMLTLAAPWPRRESSVLPAVRQLNEFARQALWMWHKLPKRAGIQHDAGPAMKLRIVGALNSRRRHQLFMEIQAPTLTRIELWSPHRRLQQLRGEGTFRTPRMSFAPGAHTLWLRGFRGRRAVAFRAISLRIPPRGRRFRCRE